MEKYYRSQDMTRKYQRGLHRAAAHTGPPEMVKSGSTPYFFGLNTVFSPFQNNPKYLDPSYKTDVDIWDCFRKGKTNLKAELS